MSPLIAVGILLLASPSLSSPEADVKTKCQNDPSCYWWTGQDSPFKKATLKGAHVKNFNTGITSNNPFFNGAFENLPQNAGFNINRNENNVDISNNPFLSNNNQKPQFPISHPAEIVGQNQQESVNNNKPDYSQNPFLQNMFTANGSIISRSEGVIGVQPKPFSSVHPLERFGDDGDYTLKASSKVTKCVGKEFICLPASQCPNGVLPEYIADGLQHIKNAEEICDPSSNHVCCKLPSSRDKSQEVNVLLPGSNNTFITAGKSSIPESLIKFGGVPGFSPGLIQVLPVEINNAGEFGNSHFGGSTSKPVRDISRSSSNNNIFGSTPDYSNLNFEDVRFASSIQGPAYLPPFGGPTPPTNAVPDLEVPVSTYIPSFPTTQKPFVTRRPLPPSPRPFQPSYSPSGNNNQFVTLKPKQPFTPEYLPPSTPRPYVPPSTPPVYRPQPSPSSPFPNKRPYTPSYIPPTITNNEYLPPSVPTSSSNVNNQYRPFPSTPKPYTPVQTIKPRPPPTFIPSTSYPSYQPSSISPFTSSYKPTTIYTYQPPVVTSPRPTVIYQPSPSIPQSTISKITPGYSKPTPGYTYPKPTPGYDYPKPTPAFNYPTTTQKPLIPSSSFNVPSTYKPPTVGYTYPKPTIINTQTTIRPRPTPGYEYPKPTPEFKYPSPTNVSPTIRPVPTRPRPTQEYLPPSPTTTQRPTPGYLYPKPTPTFGYPDRDGAPGNTNNQYIPPPKPQQPEQDGSDTSDTSVKVRPRPDVQPDQSIPRENVAPPSGCAAALKCVQEIYCSAEGVVSPVPVVLTNEQAANRVPTTVCKDISSGTLGVCCRDPNYKDPWPSANLVNGFDDGQYKEDPNLGQYRETLNDLGQFKREVTRSSRTHSRRGVPNGPVGPNENLRNQQQSSQEDTCGKRHPNSSPKGPGPLNTDFAEIPWQAMILRDSNRSLLCGGAIIKRNAVLTNAHCLDGLPTSDVLVKGGEWKLGIDEEPLPFQIVKVAVIVRHPGYQQGSLVNDLALLILEEKLRPAKNIGIICLPQPNQIPTRNCIATGWGKRILQLHAKGAVMRSVKINVMENKQCEDTLSSTYQKMSGHYSPNTLCGFSEQDQCKVDYGSALACTMDDRSYVLSGIFSWDTGCKDQNQIGGYVAPDVDWINNVLSQPIKQLKRLDYTQ